jgi:hypothetical protein
MNTSINLSYLVKGGNVALDLRFWRKGEEMGLLLEDGGVITT